MKELRMENGEVREAEEPTDPFYFQSGNHIVGSRGVYCPKENVLYQPQEGDGKGCVMCGHGREEADAE